MKLLEVPNEAAHTHTSIQPTNFPRSEPQQCCFGC